jgi:hypothetical protein
MRSEMILGELTEQAGLGSGAPYLLSAAISLSARGRFHPV